jgi:cell wall assembly regulator SMI1
MGIGTGVDLEATCDAVAFLESTLGRSLPGRMKRVVNQQLNRG